MLARKVMVLSFVVFNYFVTITCPRNIYWIFFTDVFTRCVCLQAGFSQFPSSFRVKIRLTRSRNVTSWDVFSYDSKISLINSSIFRSSFVFRKILSVHSKVHWYENLWHTNWLHEPVIDKCYYTFEFYHSRLFP